MGPGRSDRCSGRISERVLSPQHALRDRNGLMTWAWGRLPADEKDVPWSAVGLGRKLCKSSPA